jgi:hypothetical protein
LNRLKSRYPQVNAGLNSRHDALGDEVVANLLAGYGAVDGAIAGGVDLFAPGASERILDLNRIVLFGADPMATRACGDYLAQSEQRFYDDRLGGIRGTVEWIECHRHANVWVRAAGVYVRMLSAPQLFLEGNHRCGALVASYILAREGQPPFVLHDGNLALCFALSEAIKKTGRNSLTGGLALPMYRHRLAGLLRDWADGRHLRPADYHDGPGLSDPGGSSARCSGAAPP